MPVLPWNVEFQFPVGQLAGDVLRFDSSPASTGTPEGAAFPTPLKSRNCKAAILIAVISALVALILAAYFCRFRGSLRKARPPVIRRLASNEDEACESLLRLVAQTIAEEGNLALGANEISESASTERGTGSKERRRKMDSQDEYAEHAKKALVESAYSQTSGSQGSVSPSVSPFLQISSAQGEALDQWDLGHSGSSHILQQGSDESGLSPTTSGGEMTLFQEGYSPSQEWLNDFFTVDDNAHQWLHDFPVAQESHEVPLASSSRSAGRTETYLNDASKVGSVGAINVADELTSSRSPRPNIQILEAPSSTSDHAPPQPILDHQDVGELMSASGMPGGPSSSVTLVQQYQSTLGVHYIPGQEGNLLQALPSTSLWAPNIPVYALLTSTGEPLPSTSQIQVVGPLQIQISDNGTPLDQHPLYRLPRADCTEGLTPFDYTRATLNTRRTRLPDALTSIQELLSRERLSHAETQALIFMAEELVKIVHTMGKFARGLVPLWKVREPIMRRFLIVDALWSACEVVGLPMRRDNWWPEFMDKVLAFPSARIPWRRGEGASFPLIHRMVEALQGYRAGSRPSARDVIELKKEILCAPDAPALFRSSSFDRLRRLCT